MKEINLKGILPAAIVPMTADYEPDYKAYARYLDWLIEENAIALAINMDTGEGPQLTPAERRRVAEVAVGAAKGRCAVVAGVMGTTTQGAVEVARMYKEVGVDGVVVFPNAAFRNDPLAPRIPYEYHKAIADEAGLPIILFQLAPVAYTKETLDMADRSITLLTGNDRFITESFLLGAEGALLGFCAIGCGMVAEMLSTFRQGKYKEAVAMRPRVQGFGDFIYKDPVLDYRARCKVALAHIGVLEHGQTFVRPPMLQISNEESEEIKKALIQAGML
jgi:dihydrodipicolinate synthase/N-acetylneuraminate lyase